MPGTEKDCCKQWRDPRTLPPAVLEGEAEYIRGRREAAGLKVPPEDEAPKHLVGVCLSGGGIRSATFSLGVLRGLARAKLLRLADYLCTVSGGGYIGSCLSSLMTVRPPQAECGQVRDKDSWKRSCPDNAPSGVGDAADANKPELGARRFDLGDKMPLLDYHQMHHLRTHGDYLILRHGLLRREVLRTVGAIFGGIFCTLAYFAVLMFAITAAYLCYTSPLTKDGFWKDAEKAGNYPSQLELSVDAKALVGGETLTATASASDSDHAQRRWPTWRDFRELYWGKPTPADESTGADETGKTRRTSHYADDAKAIAAESSAATGKPTSPALAWWVAAACGAVLAFVFIILILIWTRRSLASLRESDASGETDAARGNDREAPEDKHSGKMDRRGFFTPRRGFSGETREDAGERRKLWVFAILTVLLGGLVAPLSVDYAIPNSGSSAPAGHVLLPLASFLGMLIMAVLLYVLLVLLFRFFMDIPCVGELWNRTFRSIYGAMTGLLVYLTLAGAVFAALTPLLYWVVRTDNWLWLIITAVVSLVTTRLAAMGASPAARPSTTVRWLLSFVRPIILVVSVFAVLLVVFLLCGQSLLRLQVHDSSSGMLVTLIATGVFLLAGFVIDFNRISPHYFYRDGLSAAYLQTEAKCDGLLRVARDDYSMTLKDLHASSGGQAEPKNPAPYQLILCALNLAGSRDLARKDRKSDHFLFSQRFCGSTTTGYVSTEDYQGGRTKLSAAMTISGAAISSGMGFHTGFCQAFAMTIFNIRLGYWWEHPWVWALKEKRRRIHFAPCWSPQKNEIGFRGWRAVLAYLITWGRGRFVFWPVYLLRELLGQTTARGMLVNLSDGGHTGDNIGIYPLLQRRCKLIIACDGEADPDLTFGSFASAIRQIYTDENIKVFIDLNRVRPPKKDGDKQDKESAPFVIGKIVYPSVEDATGAVSPKSSQSGTNAPNPETPPENSEAVTPPETADNEGWIIYLKSSLHEGCRPATVDSYAATNSDFPHQTTVDQFFDDNQFEAYRVLGESIATTMHNQYSGWCKEQQEKKEEEKVEPGNNVEELIRWCEAEYDKEPQAFEW